MDEEILHNFPSFTEQSQVEKKAEMLTTRPAPVIKVKVKSRRLIDMIDGHAQGKLSQVIPQSSILVCLKKAVHFLISQV